MTMEKQKIGYSLSRSYVLPMAEVLSLVKQAGFAAVSPIWTNREELDETVKLAKDCGLVLQSLHAPFKKAAKLWREEEKECCEAFFACVDACKEHEIPVLVVHTWIGFDYKFEESSLYFDNYDAIVSYARENGVAIAFENTEGEEFLFALMARYKDDPNVGFCWDSGHEMCYNRSRDLLAEYGDRLMMTHLNDNLGISRTDGVIFWTDDLHLLPYDGIADWEDIARRLNKAKKQEILNFELNLASKPDRHENDVYAAMPLGEYFALAYERACRLAAQYE